MKSKEVPIKTDIQIKINKAVDEVLDELEFALGSHSPMHSAHEGCAVIREEFEELWDEVKKKRSSRDIPHMRHEARQIAAMAIRFMVDVVPEDKS